MLTAYGLHEIREGLQQPRQRKSLRAWLYSGQQSSKREVTMSNCLIVSHMLLGWLHTTHTLLLGGSKSESGCVSESEGGIRRIQSLEKIWFAGFRALNPGTRIWFAGFGALNPGRRETKKTYVNFDSLWRCNDKPSRSFELRSDRKLRVLTRHCWKNQQRNDYRDTCQLCMPFSSTKAKATQHRDNNR